MDFNVSDDQRLLRDSVDRMLGDAYDDFGKRRAYAAEPDGFSRALWQRYAELGLLGLPFAEADGGFGGGPVETMLVMEAFGRALALEPYLPTVLLGGGILRLAGSDAQRRAHVPSIIDGSRRLAFAQAERQSRYDLHDVATTARAEPEGWILDGAKDLVLGGDGADLLVVSARLSGGRRDRDGLALFLVDSAQDGVQRHGHATQDGLRAAHIRFENVRVANDRLVGEPGRALPIMERVVDLALAALCAEAVGAMSVLHETTVDYLKQRKQFGIPIASFQALQHRAADMLVNLEEARSMAMYAAMMAETPDPVERRAALSASKVAINKAARSLGQEAIQLHGGIAMTWEYKAGHYFKRLTAIESLFGDTGHHLRALDEAGGLIDADTMKRQGSALDPLKAQP